MEEKQISDKKIKKTNQTCIIIILVLILISCILSIFIFKKSMPSSDVKIYIKNKIINTANGSTINMDKNLTFIIYTNDNNEIMANIINNLDELHKYQNYDYNVIEIKNHKIHCIESNCPDKICVKHGDLRDDIDNDMIICAPHKMTICH